MNKEFWNKEYTDLCEGVIFKIKQINPIDLINLATQSIDYENNSFVKQKDFVTHVLMQVMWTKNGTDWYPLVMDDGNPRLPELQTIPTLGFDIFYTVRRDVISPVFIESKTFQLLTAGQETKSK